MSALCLGPIIHQRSSFLYFCICVMRMIKRHTNYSLASKLVTRLTILYIQYLKFSTVSLCISIFTAPNTLQYIAIYCNPSTYVHPYHMNALALVPVGFTDRQIIRNIQALVKRYSIHNLI